MREMDPTVNEIPSRRKGLWKYAYPHPGLWSRPLLSLGPRLNPALLEPLMVFQKTPQEAAGGI